MEVSSGIQLTRYLYMKDEVILALVLSIIQKDISSYFWAFELYYSGYERDLINTFWSLYYDFFYSLNPTFEKYLLNKLKNNLKNDTDNDDHNSITIGNIIENFKMRNHNMDVFILREISNQFEFDTTFINNYIETKNFEYFKQNLIELVNTKDYIMISYLILTILCEEHFDILLETFIEIFKLDREKIFMSYKKIRNKIDTRRILLSRFIHFTSCDNIKSNSTKKNIYITIDSSDVFCYKTIESSLCKNETDRSLMPYRILSKVQLSKINTSNSLSLFCLKRENKNIRDIVIENWLYYASFSPLWEKRIMSFRGKIVHEIKEIIFEDEELQDEFFNKYDMELDEQSAKIQDAIFNDICKKRTISDLYLQHNKNSIINLDNDILGEMDKLQY
jgi:hypothetical protein